MLARSNTSSSSDTPAFPTNLYFEGADQHSRWFLCSLVSSIMLTRKAPFLALKTHGLIIDEREEKMSKSFPDYVIDPEDLIAGTEKISG